MNNDCYSNTFANNCCCLCKKRSCRCNNIVPIPGPTGPQGPSGTNATIAIGTTTTLPSGSNATVTNSGTSTNAVLNFGIPRGKAAQTNNIYGSFISRIQQTFDQNNSIINLPTILSSNNITISDGIITIEKDGRYTINYGITSSTSENLIGIYVNGSNVANTNIRTSNRVFNPSSQIILNLNRNDTLSLRAINAQTNPLTLDSDTINAYITMSNLD